MKSLYEYLRQWISCWRTTSFPSANKSSRLYSIRSYSVIQWTGTCRSRIVWLTTMHKTTSMIRGTQYKGKKVVHDTTNLLGITELKKNNNNNNYIYFIQWLWHSDSLVIQPSKESTLILSQMSPKMVHNLTNFSGEVRTLTSHKWLQTVTVTNNKITSPCVFYIPIPKW